MSTIKDELNEEYKVSQWSRKTVADGNALNRKTIKPLIERDEFLADKIDEFATAVETEAKERKEADDELNTSIQNEISAREAEFQGFLDKIEEEANIREYTDDRLTSNLNFEAERREYEDSKLNEAISAENLERKEEDSKLNSSISALNNSLNNHIKQKVSLSTSGHLTKDDYKKFNNVYDTVYSTSANWDNISAINIGDNTISASEITFNGKKNIGVSSENSSITFFTSGSVGTSAKPIYLDKNGTFKTCNMSELVANKFGNAIISINGTSANSTYFVNNNPQKWYGVSGVPLNDHKIETQERNFITFYTTDVLDHCFSEGVNNAIVRFDGYNGASGINNGRFKQENIVDLSIDVGKLEKYKMYNIDLVPLYQSQLPNISGCEYHNEYANLQYSVSFVSNESPIDFSTPEYKCKTYGYHYNVPAFGVNLRDLFQGKDISENKSWFLPNRSENSDLTNENWQIFLNNTNDSEDGTVCMYTLQPHSEISLYTNNNTIDNKESEYSNVKFENYGNKRITAIWCNVDTNHQNYYISPKIYRRQISFMRGEDIIGSNANTKTILSENHVMCQNVYNNYTIPFYIIMDYEHGDGRNETTKVYVTGNKLTKYNYTDYYVKPGKDISSIDTTKLTYNKIEAKLKYKLNNYTITEIKGRLAQDANISIWDINNLSQKDILTSAVKFYCKDFDKSITDVKIDNLYAYINKVNNNSYRTYCTSASVSGNEAMFNHAIKGLHVNALSGYSAATAASNISQEKAYIVTTNKFKAITSARKMYLSRSDTPESINTDYSMLSYYDRAIITEFNKNGYSTTETSGTAKFKYEVKNNISGCCSGLFGDNYNIDVNVDNDNYVSYELSYTPKNTDENKAYTLYYFSQATY